MKLRKKALACFTATVLALSMMVGTALATEKIPAVYEDAAGGTVVDGETDGNHVWMSLFGGTAATPITDDVAVRDSVRTVDVVITGNATFDAEFVLNYQTPGWTPVDLGQQTVDGELVLSTEYDGTDQDWAEFIVNLRNKSEGPLEVTRIDFKDGSGNVVASLGDASAPAADAPADDAPADDAPAADVPADDSPKTGVASSALIFGLSAIALGSGAVVLKKKED